jgi:hypothetical protein
VEIALNVDPAAPDPAGALAEADVGRATGEGRTPGRLAAPDVPEAA